MNYDKYSDISISSDSLDYKFISIGKNGDLSKLVKFNPVSGNDQIYNLALGTIKEDGKIDFITPSRNGDRDKILATIGAIAFIFSETYPEKIIFLTGDTNVKTRLYQIAINDAYEEIAKIFIILGLKMINGTYQSIAFEKGVNYDGFLFKRRKDKETTGLLEI